VLLDHFAGLTPADLAELTDWQIETLYFYPRDAEGKLRLPEVLTKDARRGPDVEAHIRAYLAVAHATNTAQPGAFPEEAIAAAVKEIRAYHEGVKGEK
jgi:hypothetical protein